MNISDKTIIYKFSRNNQSFANYEIVITGHGTLHPDCFSNSSSPNWAKLSFNKCPHCPLNDVEHKYCPTSLALNLIGNEWNDVKSYEKIDLEVNLQERKVSAHTTTQVALSSLVGLLMGASECPHLAFFHPLARNHLPLATPEETGARVLKNFLSFNQLYEKSKANLTTQIEDVYQNLETLNRYVSQRLSSAENENLTTQAVVQLDCLTKLVPASIQESKKSLIELFATYGSINK